MRSWQQARTEVHTCRHLLSPSLLGNRGSTLAGVPGGCGEDTLPPQSPYSRLTDNRAGGEHTFQAVAISAPGSQGPREDIQPPGLQSQLQAGTAQGPGHLYMKKCGVGETLTAEN